MTGSRNLEANDFGFFKLTYFDHVVILPIKLSFTPCSAHAECMEDQLVELDKRMHAHFLQIELDHATRARSFIIIQAPSNSESPGDGSSTGCFSTSDGLGSGSGSLYLKMQNCHGNTSEGMLPRPGRFLYGERERRSILGQGCGPDSDGTVISCR